MKVAAFQAPLFPSGSMLAIDLIRNCIARCEAEGAAILCCPEAILGGLADYAADPAASAISVENGQLAAILAPLTSETVTAIVGFTENAGDGRLYNSAAVFHRGGVTGVYRKLHPAIRKSVYEPGDAMPVFTVDGLTFGIVICNDSNFAEPARVMASRGARVLFVPSNNGLPPERADIVRQARKADIARATENNMWVVRADVAGTCTGSASYGSSSIINPEGTIVESAAQFTPGLILADLGSEFHALGRNGCALPENCYSSPARCGVDQQPLLAASAESQAAERAMDAAHRGAHAGAR